MPKKKVEAPALKTPSGIMPAIVHRSFDLSRRTYQADVIFSHLLRSCTMEEMLVKVVLDRDDRSFMGTFLRSYYIICEPQRLLKLLLDLYKDPKIRLVDPDEEEQSECDKKSDEDAKRSRTGLGVSKNGLRGLTASQLAMIGKHQGEDIDEGSSSSFRQLIRTGIAATIKHWIDLFFDFYDDPTLMETVMNFIKAQETASSSKKKRKTNPIDILFEAVGSFRVAAKAYKLRSPYPAVRALNPQPVLPILAGKMSPEHLAQQFTLMEYDLICRVRPRDLLEQTVDSNALRIYTNHFTNTRQFFVAEIGSQVSAKAWTATIKKAIQTAQACISYNNFNTLMEILSALCSPTVTANEKAWEMLETKTFRAFEDLCGEMCSDNSYKRYRTLLSEAPSPCVPFLGVHVGDVRFINDFDQTEFYTDVFNINKLRSLAKEFSNLQALQGAEYPFVQDNEFRERLVENFTHIPEMFASHPPLGEAQASSSTTSERLQVLRTRYESFYSDANILGKEEFNFSVMQLRPRDWSVLTSSAKRQTFQPSQVIFEQETKTENANVAFLKEGTVIVKRSEIILREQKAPAMIGALGLLDAVDTSFVVIAETECVVDFVETRFLVSLLESDSHLSLRFFTQLAFQLIKQLHYGHTAILKTDTQRSGRARLTQAGSSQLLSRHLVVKPMRPGSNPILSIDPKILRDSHFRKLFSLTNDEVLIKEFKSSMFSRTIYAPGTLFISQRHVCFYAKLFNHKTKIIMSISEIEKVYRKKNKLIIESSERKRKMVLRMKDSEEEDALTLLLNLLDSLDQSAQPSEPRAPLTPPPLENHTSTLEKWRESTKDNELGLTVEDWNLILRGAKRLVVRKDAVIVSENSDMQRIFQLVRGNCRIQMSTTDPETGETKEYVVGTITPTEIFGEVSFVQRKGSSTSVVASDEVEVCVIEGYYVKRLLSMRPELAGRFLHYICSVLQRRVNQGDRFEDQEERKVIDLITEPLHHNLIKFPVLPPTSLEPITLLKGPHDDEAEERQIKEQSATDYCAGTAISTYPMLQVITDDPDAEPTFAREGSPICDQYRAYIFPTRTIVAVADGCNWGDPPRNAARAALSAFTQYLCAHQAEIGDVQYAGRLVLRALSMANAEIFKGVDAETTMIGTTTLLGGIILELDVDEDPLEEEPENPPNYGFVYVTIGDCKAFHWSSVTKEFSDITASNRTGMLSASDCGGRLGPYEENLPDLRNLELGLFACHEGDYILIVSDGVHDNLDPAHLGFQPRDLTIDADSWDTVPDFVQTEEIKNEYRLGLLRKVIYRELDSAVEKYTSSSKRPVHDESDDIPSPLEVVNNILSYCTETCAASATWMQNNPHGRLPKDYRLYPGKMDHTTCVCLKIGEQSE